jgi:hypothetical protein
MKVHPSVRSEEIVKHRLSRSELLSYQRGGVNQAKWSGLRSRTRAVHDEGFSVCIVGKPETAV